MSCSAGDGAVGPNRNHHYSFGVDMGPSGAMGCMASGGEWGANGGSLKMVEDGDRKGKVRRDWSA